MAVRPELFLQLAKSRQEAFRKCMFELPRFERSVLAVGFEFGEGNALLDRHRPVERNQIRLLSLVVYPHDEEHPILPRNQDPFTYAGDVQGRTFTLEFTKSQMSQSAGHLT